MVEIELTWHGNVRNQINTIEKLGTKLKYSVNDRNQIRSLHKNILPISFFI